MLQHKAEKLAVGLNLQLFFSIRCIGGSNDLKCLKCFEPQEGQLQTQQLKQIFAKSGCEESSAVTNHTLSNQRFFSTALHGYVSCKKALRGAANDGRV